MRNPWPMAIVLTMTAVSCVLWEKYVSLRTLWILVVVLIAIGILGSLAYVAYNNWLLEEIYTAGRRYQKHQQLKALELGFRHWRHRATAEARSVMRIYYALALIGHGKWHEARHVIDELMLYAETLNDWLNVYLVLGEYAVESGDVALEEQARMRIAALQKRMDCCGEETPLRATKGQCRQAFWHWCSFSVSLCLGGFLLAFLFPFEPILAAAAGAVVLHL